MSEILMKLMKGKLVPTQGAYQKDRECTLLRETSTLYVVQVEGQTGERRFRKEDGFGVGWRGKEFPCWRLVLEATD